MISADRQQFDAMRLCVEQELWTNSGRFEVTDHHIVFVNTFLLETEDFLHRDCVTFHPGDFRKAGYAAAAITEA